MAIKRKSLVILGVLVLLLGSAVPSAAARGGGRGGGGHFGGRHVSGGRLGGGHFGGGRFHHGFHRGGCCWWGGPFVGGVALGAALAYPYYAYPYYPYPYYPDPYPVYAPLTVVEPPPVAYQAPPVQREVVYPHGKYVLYGDGMTQPWRWVWMPAAPPPPLQQ